jgi:hypothetical protein
VSRRGGVENGSSENASRQRRNAEAYRGDGNGGITAINPSKKQNISEIIKENASRAILYCSSLITQWLIERNLSQ